MNKRIFLFGIFAIASIALFDDSLAYEFKVDKPRIKISIPDFPSLNMKPHPMRSAQPHLLYAGSNDKYAMTILAPTADAGMTVEECANSKAKYYVSRHSLKETQGEHVENMWGQDCKVANLESTCSIFRMRGQASFPQVIHT